MEVGIKLDENAACVSVVIITNELTDEVYDLKRRIEEQSFGSLKAYSSDSVMIIPQEDILSVFSEDKKVFCRTENGVYQLKSRLYELEETLNKKVFVRISNSEIVNAKKIEKLDISISGTIGVFLKGAQKTYASRRYVKRLKEFFGV